MNRLYSEGDTTFQGCVMLHHEHRYTLPCIPSIMYVFDCNSRPNHTEYNNMVCLIDMVLSDVNHYYVYIVAMNKKNY